MAQYRSVRQPFRRAQRRSSVRFLFTVLLTTGMVATGGFGALPDNPITQTFQEEIGQNVPETILNPINSYLEQLAAPTIQPQPVSASPSGAPLDVVGFLFDSFAAESGITPTAIPESPTTTPTHIITPSSTLTPTLSVTPSSTSALTFTPTSTSTPPLSATPACITPSTTIANTTFFNGSARTIEIYWIDFSCRLVLYHTLGPGQSVVQGTYIGHRWQFVDTSTTRVLAYYVVSSANQFVDVSTGAVATPTPTPQVTTIVTAAPFVGFSVSAVDLNGSGSVATVSPGIFVTVTYNFRVFSDPCPGCITQLVTGLGTPGSHGEWCAYDGVPGVFPGATGFESNALIAPSTPGTFPVVVEYHWQYTCADALTNYGSGGATGSAQVIGQIIVQ